MKTVNSLSWPELNRALAALQDVKILQRWLRDTVAGGSLYRALRVHGRMNAVRREQEIAAIRRGIEGQNT